MKAGWLFLLLVTAGLSSCMWGTPHNPKPDITTDTLAYTYKIIKERATDCGNKPDSGCTVVKIKYPVFNAQPELNDSVKHKLLKLFSVNDGKDTSLTQLPSNFIRGYNTDKGKNERDMFYTLDAYANVIRQDSSLVTLEFGGYAFEGGAHGGSQTIFINWDSKRSKKILLSDILITGYPDKLNEIAEHIFRKQENLKDNASLANDYFFEHNKFGLNNNYLITPLGIRFLYNEYEIKPYAAGQTELLIPYSKIKSLLRPNTVVSQYLK